MQQFLVPQFIDVENKILGPITVRQFVIIILTMGITFIFNKIFDFSLFLVSTLMLVVIAGAFAFLKINGTPFHLFILNVIQTAVRPSLRIWRKEVQVVSKADKASEIEEVSAVSLVKKDEKLINSSRLSELSLIVNTGGYYKGEE